MSVNICRQKLQPQEYSCETEEGSNPFACISFSKTPNLLFGKLHSMRENGLESCQAHRLCKPQQRIISASTVSGNSLPWPPSLLAASSQLNLTTQWWEYAVIYIRCLTWEQRWLWGNVLVTDFTLSIRCRLSMLCDITDMKDEPKPIECLLWGPCSTNVLVNGKTQFSLCYWLQFTQIDSELPHIVEIIQ